tara:strand:- start:4798 stop:6252 length:1455 start_codon:yes stop_codon:yes gene_type:complete
MSSPSSLPAILNVATIPTIENMNVKTEVLDPITLTSTQAVFQIPKTGILDGGSMLQLGVLADPTQFFPLTTGIHGLIRSVFLKVGGKVLASNDDYAYYTTMTRQFETPEQRAYVDMVKSGACGDRWGVVGSGRLAPRDLDGTITGVEANDTFDVPTLFRPTLSDTTTPLFCVPLSTLLPMMRSRQIPLLAIKDHVYLEINFNTQAANAAGKIVCSTKGQEALSGVALSTPNIKFISDHLYYTQPQMQGIVAQTLTGQGLSVLYEDLITTFAAVPPPATPGAGQIIQQAVERQIAVSGKTIRNIMVQTKNQGETHAVLGEYISRDLVVPTAYNLRINDQRIYDRDVQAPPRKYHELKAVMGKPLMCPSQVYSFDADSDKQNVPTLALNQCSMTIGKVMGHQCVAANGTANDCDLRSTSSYIGYDATTSGVNMLGNGAKIGVKPVSLQMSLGRGNPASQRASREVRIFTGVERVFNLRNGEITISA